MSPFAERDISACTQCNKQLKAAGAVNEALARADATPRLRRAWQMSASRERIAVDSLFAQTDSAAPTPSRWIHRNGPKAPRPRFAQRSCSVRTAATSGSGLLGSRGVHRRDVIQLSLALQLRAARAPNIGERHLGCGVSTSTAGTRDESMLSRFPLVHRRRPRLDRRLRALPGYARSARPVAAFGARDRRTGHKCPATTAIARLRMRTSSPGPRCRQ